MPASTRAQATGWRVAALQDHVYPALIPATSTADGLLIEGLTSHEWRTLDAFENDLYQLRKLPLDDGRSGWAYVCLDEADVLPHSWDLANFADHELSSYVERCRQWRHRYESRTVTP